MGFTPTRRGVEDASAWLLAPMLAYGHRDGDASWVRNDDLRDAGIAVEEAEGVRS